MTGEIPGRPFSAALDRAAAQDRRLFRVLVATWSIGLAALAFVVWRWTVRLDTLEGSIRTIEASTQKLEVSVAEVRRAGPELEASGQRATALVAEAREALDRAQAQMTKANAEIARVGGELADARKSLADLSVGVSGFEEQQKKKIGELDASLASLAGQVETTRKASQEARAQLQQVERTAAQEFAYIHRQLRVAHYLFQTKDDNEVAGLGIFINFRAPLDRSHTGIAAVCVSEAKGGPCLGGRRNFLKLGEAMNVETKAYRFTITPAYYLGNPLQKDYVGFGILREEIGSGRPPA